MQSKSLEYYEWDEIEEFLCDAMNIPRDKFRDYHAVVGDEYKDFWHVWLWFVDDRLFNDSYMPTYLGEDSSANNEYLLKRMSASFGAWSHALLPAIDALKQQTGPDIIIHYSW